MRNAGRGHRRQPFAFVIKEELSIYIQILYSKQNLLRLTTTKKKGTEMPPIQISFREKHIFSTSIREKNHFRDDSGRNGYYVASYMY